MNTSTKARISALLPTPLIDEMRRVSQKERVPQGRIIEKALRLWLHHRLESDAQELARMRFDDLPTEDEWAMIQPEVK